MGAGFVVSQSESIITILSDVVKIPLAESLPFR